MKTLILTRHAKSSWKDPGLRDHARPLNGRGRRVAPQVAAKLVAFTTSHDLVPARIVTSDAVRALATAQTIASAFEGAGLTIPLEPREDLYLAEEDTWFEAVWTLDAECESVLMVGHNPGLHDFVNALAAKATLEHFPTCAVAMLSFEARAWSKVQARSGSVDEFWAPKEIGIG